MNKAILTSMAMLASSMMMADEVEVKTFSYAGPYVVKSPIQMDSVDVFSKEYAPHTLLDYNINLSAVETGKEITSGTLPGCETSEALHLIGFTVTNNAYINATISVKGLSSYKVYVDDKQVNGGVTTLLPSVHKVVIKYLSKPEKQDSATVTVDAGNSLVAPMTSVVKHPYSLSDVMNSRTCTFASISANGRYLLYNTSETMPDGTTTRSAKMRDLQTGTTVDCGQNYRWMPKSNCMYYTRKNSGIGYTLLAVDPATRKETVLTNTLPVNSFTMSPTEDYIIYTEKVEGPKEKKEIFEVIEPDDRQPGWRNRYNLYKYDFRSGLTQQLTFGHHSIYLMDISQDGKYILASKTESRLTARPTTLMSIFRINMDTYAIDTIVSRDGFVSDASFSPDGKQILVTGTPEALEGIGKNVAEGQTPSAYDYQLYLSPVIGESTDFSPANWKALTRDFNPCVSSVNWSSADGMIYFTAEDKDYVNLFRLNPKTGKFVRIDTGVELMKRFSLAESANAIAYCGQGASYGDRLYVMNTKNLKRTLIEDIDEQHMASVSLGKCEPWNYVNENGDTVTCRYYLPANFDKSKTYPVIVNYYGGCSPTSRNFQSRYPQHAYASLGYVVLVINPRGATGFGQKWSAAHVNTAGQGVAEDIIGATKTFCKEHTFVNPKKIGCVGASYGGFMTQYLQTVTDIFAAAVSHAGISDHTSYWGEGYWGYSYSEVSMANSYPWTRKDLYVDQSPLYNADKIHTPLLFVHGTGDTNVPVGESIQMYTALKLLGRPTAMVLVEGENHWILDYKKRIQWQNTIWAWFAKYLQDDSSWWDSMYSHKDL